MTTESSSSAILRHRRSYDRIPVKQVDVINNVSIIYHIDFSTVMNVNPKSFSSSEAFLFIIVLKQNINVI